MRRSWDYRTVDADGDPVPPAIALDEFAVLPLAESHDPANAQEIVDMLNHYEALSEAEERAIEERNARKLRGEETEGDHG